MYAYMGKLISAVYTILHQKRDCMILRNSPELREAYDLGRAEIDFLLHRVSEAKTDIR